MCLWKNHSIDFTFQQHHTRTRDLSIGQSLWSKKWKRSRTAQDWTRKDQRRSCVPDDWKIPSLLPSFLWHWSMLVLSRCPSSLELTRNLSLSLHEINKVRKSETMKSKVMCQSLNVVLWKVIWYIPYMIFTIETLIFKPTVVLDI